MVTLSTCCGQEFNHTELQIAYASQNACQDCQPSTQSLPTSSQMLQCHGSCGHLWGWQVVALQVQLVGGGGYHPFCSGVARGHVGGGAPWVLETQLA